MLFKIAEAEKLIGEEIRQIMPVRNDLYILTDTRILKIPYDSEVYEYLVEEERIEGGIECLALKLARV